MYDRSTLRNLSFAGLTVAVWLTAAQLVTMLPTLDRPDIIALALIVDLTLLIPAAYYVLVVRPRGWPAMAVAPIAVLSVIAAEAIMPAQHAHALRFLRVAAIPLELGILAWLGYHVQRRVRKLRQSPVDPLNEIRAVTRDLLGDTPLARVVASELAVFFFALASWRLRTAPSAGDAVLTSHRRSGHGGIVVALLLVLTIEGLGVHILLAQWSVVIAWIATVLTAYSALWLLADYRATVLRPLAINDTHIDVRAGLRWEARVPRDCIVEVMKDVPEDSRALSLAFMTPPNVWLTFSRPITFQGPYGLRRTVRSVGVFVDSPGALLDRN